ncbi:MAG: HAD family hydrolase [Steroidobacteraceae bacterium]
MPPPLTPRAAVFDIEGTLVDCLSLTLESWRETLQEAGHTVSYRDLQPLFGMDGLWMLNRLLPKERQDFKQHLLTAQGERYRREFLRRAQPFPGVRSLFAFLKQEGVLIGIGTTCQKEEVAVYDERLGILELTDALTCGESAPHGKPDPSLFEQCLRKLGIEQASHAIAVGDTPYDAIAAKNLGMECAGVLTGGFSQRALREAGCDLVLQEVQNVRTLWQKGSGAAARVPQEVDPLSLPHNGPDGHGDLS